MRQLLWVLIIFLYSFTSCSIKQSITLKNSAYNNNDIVPHIEEAIRSGAKTIFLTRGDYHVKSLLDIENQDNITINGRNARLLLSKLPVEPGPAIIKINNSDNCRLIKLHIDGNRSKIETPRLLHSVFIYNSKGVVLKDLSVHNNLGDGIQIASDVNSKKEWSENILIQNCHVNNSTRNGLSLINLRNIKVINSSFNNSNGSPPQAGIDIEPDEDSVRPGVSDVLFKNITVQDNKGNGFAIPHFGAPRDISIHNSTITGNLSGIWTCGVNLSIQGNSILSNGAYGICSIRYPEYDISPDSIRIHKNEIRDSKLGIYYRGQGGLISNNRILHTTDEGIEVRKHHDEVHSVTIKDNFISRIAGTSGIASDFDETIITGNKIENCKENGVSVHRGLNIVNNNSISSCAGYSILVNDAYCEIENNKISYGGKYYIWFNGYDHKNTGGKIIKNILIEPADKDEYLIYDTSGNIEVYQGNKIKGRENNDGTVILKKMPPKFNDKQKAVKILKSIE